ncbi:MAG: hypothetical protein ACKOFP_14690 [Actinomycetota bacterium]
MRTRIALGAAMLSLTLAACSSPSSTLSPGDNVVIDCAAASTAIGDFGTSLQSLITALTNSDGGAASTAADQFATSADAVSDSLPGLPPEAQPFVTLSRDFAERVKDVVGGGGDLPALTAEAQTFFAEPDFVQSADAIEAFYRQKCPQEAATQGQNG